LRKILVALIAAIGVASAAPIGTLDIAGTDVVRITATMINWGPLGEGTGDFIVTGRSGDYTALPPLAPGEITDLDITTAPPGPPLATPIDPFILVPVPGPMFSFNLERIALGGGPSCTPPPPVGQSCTPSEIVANSPFLLTQTSTGVSVSLSVRGTVTDLSDDTSIPYTGLFTANLTAANVNTVAEVLAAFGPGGPGFVESSWSAQLTSIPEPGTMFTMIGVVLVLGGRFMAKKIRA
jgi:hypothetical protein